MTEAHPSDSRADLSKNLSDQGVWVAEAELYGEQRRVVRAKGSTAAEAREKLMEWMNTWEFAVGRDCYAPAVRQEIEAGESQ